MSNIRYNTFSSSLQTAETRYYSAAELTNSLERLGSSQLDLDVLGTTVSRLTKDQQMCKILKRMSKFCYLHFLVFFRKVMLITTGQFMLISLFSFFTKHIYPLFQWLKDRYLTRRRENNLTQIVSTYSWWIVLIPAIIIAAIMIWQLKTQFYQLSPASKVTMLSLYSVAIAVVISHTSKLLCIGFVSNKESKYPS